jgi:hypothetical protein
MAILILILLVCGVLLYLFITLSAKKESDTKIEVAQNPPQEKVIRPKVGFDHIFSLSSDKIIPKEIHILSNAIISRVTDFIRSIPPTALDLHPIFDHELIERGGAYKYWDFPTQMLRPLGLLYNSDHSYIQIRIEITCSDKKGTIHFYFPKGKSIYSYFNFDGEKTVLNSTYFMKSVFRETIEFSREDLFKQKDKPMFINLKIPEDRPFAKNEKNETPYYDYFLFKDRLFKIDKELGDLEKKAEIIKEFYEREKQAGRFDLEEQVESKERSKEQDDGRKILESVKREIWRRDGGKCSECGSRNNLEFHHIIPFSKGGSNTARNIELLCMECNRKKSNQI